MILNSLFYICSIHETRWESARNINEFRCANGLYRTLRLIMNFKIIIAIMFFRENGSVGYNEIVEMRFSQNRYVKIYHLIAITVAVRKKEIKRNSFYMRLNLVLLRKLRVND